ncbi:GNAT family N-acetyltransferase [uncultured Litoreibacter sp.]|uniref:GNAT family N-acetyltransferase n=1 Tax=uncultured Litoreibacter sp. TaxID=1392394 RepID=UPI0026332166|nr:GNAT family N-acetyltransferase [uncultured Litoreibacter sp.]
MIAPTLHTERLTLRPLALSDFEPLAAFYESDRSKYVGGPKRPDETWRALACEIGHWTLRGYGRFGVDETATGKFVGMVGPWFPDAWPEPELGWDLMNGFEGRGFATEAGLATRDFVYKTLGWKTAISLVADGNLGSAKVAERMGATWESKLDHPMFGMVNIYRHAKPEAV